MLTHIDYYLLEYIHSYIRSYGHAPSSRAMMRGANLDKKSLIITLRRLENSGLIQEPLEYVNS
jgi:SOS-response transcriptional repressor LexA